MDIIDYSNAYQWFSNSPGLQEELGPAASARYMNIFSLGTLPVREQALAELARAGYIGDGSAGSPSLNPVRPELLGGGLGLAALAAAALFFMRRRR